MTDHIWQDNTKAPWTDTCECKLCGLVVSNAVRASSWHPGALPPCEDKRA